MNAGSVAAIRSLKSINESDANAGNALLHLLGSVGQASLADYVSAPDHWFASRSDVVFAISVEGMAAITADIDLACDMLDAAEPLLQQAEQLLGIELDPHDLQPKRQIMQDFPEALVARIRSADVTLWIAVQPHAEYAVQWQAKAEMLPLHQAAAPVRIRVMLTAARLSLEQAAGIASGDLLLLARNIPAMIVTADDLRLDRIDGHFDCRSGAFGAGAIFDDGDADMADDDLEQSGSTAAAFAVPITLQLPGQFIDASMLVALAPGYVLPLSPLVQGLQVDLLVGGRRIARGEIVEMGDSFAVHIDERLTPAPCGQPADSGAEDEG
jgi:flagellar motor switch/type III secretory pathway protein FliN